MRKQLLAAFVSLALLYGWSSLTTAPAMHWSDDLIGWIKCVVKPASCGDER